MKKVLIALAIIVPLALIAAAGLYLYDYFFTQPYEMAKNYMPQRGVTLSQGKDGMLTLSWPKGENVDDYVVELKSGDRSFWTAIYTDTSCLLPGKLELTGDVTLTITSRKGYETPRGSFLRECEEPLTASYPAEIPSFANLQTKIDPNLDTLTMSWDTTEGGVYTISDSLGEKILETREGGALLYFGEDVPMPAKDEVVTYTLTCGLEGYDVDFKTDVSVPVNVAGEDLRGEVLLMDMIELGNNYYVLNWNETRGERYELQYLTAAGEWSTFKTFSDTDELRCTLGPLEPYSEYTVRVTAQGGHTMPNSEFAATPAVISFTTEATTMFANIWVLKDLDIWSDPYKSQKVGTATTDRCYCVMGEENGYFLIYTDDTRGYIDSTYCLINLPDYMGDLVAYDITNSYDSIYMVHDYGIPRITNTVITGYEEVASDYVTVEEERTVRQDVDEEGNKIELPQWKSLYETEKVEVSKPSQFLVPLLYPTAKKILQSALTAREDGYRLKIYDAYRPYIATRFLYDLTESLLQNQVPELTYPEMAGDRWRDYLASILPPEETGEDEGSEGSGETDEPGEAGEVGETGEIGNIVSAPDTTSAPATAETPASDTSGGPRPSYYTVMTDGKYSLSAFLARSGSYHNMGVAVDLTLESLDTGEELEMQTAIHDLSWNSILSLNNDNAKLLAGYMTGSNLATLSSEWWHFQDDELRGRVKDLVLRQEGVTCAGWIADNGGWRYRDHDGMFLRDGTFTVNGRRYTFDGNGYADYAWWESN